jgi:dCTP deaminase
MILSGLEIQKRLGNEIIIEPFQESQLNSNSYNLRLADELLVYSAFPLDMKKENPVERLIIPPEGILLEPQKLYLAQTVEFTKTSTLVPMLEGRSSIGRLGLFVHVTAGFGDVGFAGFWTLEMFCVHPIRIYAGIEICQIFYHSIEGDYEVYNSKKYQNNKGVQPSLLYKDFEDDAQSQNTETNVESIEINK